MTGDTTYGTVENIVAVEDAGIQAFFPLPDFDRHTPFFGKGDFTYDPVRDAYRCPQGQVLPRRKTKHTEAEGMYRADAASCNLCPLKAQCTASDHGRMVHRSFSEEYLDTVRGYHETVAYQKAMRKRQVWVEPLFAEAKDWHGLRRFRLRGLEKGNGEALLFAAGQNVKRLLSRSGRGRRPFPSGAAGAVLPSLPHAEQPYHDRDTLPGPARWDSRPRCACHLFQHAGPFLRQRRRLGPGLGRDAAVSQRA